MQVLTGDEGVFIRSLASRGAVGGLSAAAGDAVVLLDAFGKDVVLIETVGAGQDEFDIVNAAHTTVVINTPGTGDDIQIMKAGIMEIADIYGVNKADLPGADLTVNQLRSLLSTNPSGVRTAEIIRMVAITGDGIDDLADACDTHYEFLVGSGQLDVEDRKRARCRIVSLAQDLLVANLFSQSGGDKRLDYLAAAVADRTLDPHTAVKQWVEN
jgi:LAO/AO transport system kinase